MLVKEILTSTYVKIDRNATLSELIGLLKRNKEKSALIFDNKKYVGVTSQHFFRRLRLDPSKVKVRRALVHVPILNVKDTLREAARLMYTSDCRMLPMIEKNKLLGVVKIEDIVEHLRMTHGLLKVGKIMSAAPLLIEENEGLAKAIEIMKENHITRIPVVDKKKRIISVLSTTDIMEKFHLFHQKSDMHAHGSIPSSGPLKTRGFRDKVDFASYPVKALASYKIITASENDSVDNILDLMKKHEISTVIIAEKDKVKGIVTKRNLLKLLIV